MTTPTQYDLTYEDPCQQEEGCSVEICGNKVKENNRPQVFCEDVTIEKSLTSGLITTISPFTVDQLGFCPGTVETLTGPVTVLLLCGEGGPASGGGAPVSCPTQLKVDGPLRVAGEACIEKSLKVMKDGEVEGNFSSNDFTSKGNSKISGDFQVGSSAKVGADLTVSGNLVTDGSSFSKNAYHDGNVFSTNSSSNAVYTKELVVGGYLYQEEIITAVVGGEQREITVLVKSGKVNTPSKENKPDVTVSDPIAPVAPCPSVECQ